MVNKEALKKIINKTGNIVNRAGKRTDRLIESGLKNITKSISPNKQLKNKQVLKKQKQIVVKIPDYKAPSVLGDTNRFFKSEMEEAKNLFFS